MSWKIAGDTIISTCGKTLDELHNEVNTNTSAISSLKNAILETIFPIGSLYQSIDGTDPKDVLGIGTWERIQGVFLLAGNDAYEQYAPGATGGEVTHTLTVNEMPVHTHVQNAHGHRARYNSTGSVGGTRDIPISSGSSWKAKATWIENTTATNQNTGGGAAHNNMPPFLAVYIWKRTA